MKKFKVIHKTAINTHIDGVDIRLIEKEEYILDENHPIVKNLIYNKYLEEVIEKETPVVIPDKKTIPSSNFKDRKSTDIPDTTLSTVENKEEPKKY